MHRKYSRIFPLLIILTACENVKPTSLNETSYFIEESETAWPMFDVFLQKNGIADDYDAISAHNLLIFSHRSVIENVLEVEKLTAKAKSLTKTDKIQAKALRKRAEDLQEIGSFLGSAEDVANLAIASSSLTLSQRIEAFEKCKRILYTSLVNDPNVNHYGIRAHRRMQITMILRFFTRYLTQSIPYMTPSTATLKISKRQARREARPLYHVIDSHDEPVHDLTTLSYQEIAKLDISRNHTSWHQERTQTTEMDWTNWIQKRLTRHLKKKVHDPEFNYQIDNARRVLFFSKIKKNATSPKAKLRDAFGQRWKIKWGDEIQTEAIASHLYYAAGGKFTDFVYANGSGAEQLTVILADPKKKAAVDECQAYDRQTLVTCIKENYRFNLRPFILDSGQIDANNVAQILHNLSPYALKKYRPQKMLGRHYVTFRESSVELKPSAFITRGKSVTLTSSGAVRDRALRGLLMFNLFIANIDSREPNWKSYLIHRDNGESRYLESQHDMGATFGGIFSYGNINQLGIGRKFLRVTHGGRKLSFFSFMPYFPKTWRKATYSDALWMAKRIASMSIATIQEAAEKSNWPPFVRNVLVYRLVARRNHMAELFGLEGELDTTQNSAPNTSVFLGTKEARHAAAKSFGLETSVLEAQFEKAHLSTTYTDLLVSKGRLRPCFKSLIVNLVEKKYFPSGITRRVSRSPLANWGNRTCTFGRTTLRQQIQYQVQEQIQNQDAEQDQVQVQE